jgi:hypothetical protein
MKSKIFLIPLLISLTSYSQVGIGTNTPDASSILEVASTDKGFLPPRVASDASITNPTAGLTIYDESDNCLNVYSGTAWVNLCNNSGGGSNSGGSVPAAAGFIRTCEEAGLINPKQVETSFYNFANTAMISSNDEIWMIGKTTGSASRATNISNRRFNFSNDYNTALDYRYVEYITEGFPHKISTPKEGTLVPSKIIAANKMGNPSTLVTYTASAQGENFLVEFTNGERYQFYKW